MQIDLFKPWCNVAENEEWKYKPHYAHAEVDGWMDDFEKEKQWYAYLDLCFQNRFIYLNQVEFFPGVFDIGVFCKQKVPLKFLYTKIFGYLEEITYAKFNELKELGHPSLYHYNNHVNIHDARFTSENHYFVLFGELSCVNYDITSIQCIVKLS